MNGSSAIVRAFFGGTIGLNIVLSIMLFTLTRDVPESGNVCVPLYDATGLECIDKGCVGK